MEESTHPLEPGEGKKGIRSEWFVAMAAVAVSLLTMFVYIYQARIMQQQQHVSVWPYIEWTMTIRTDEGLYLSVMNKGVGPAKIQKTRLLLGDSVVADYRQMLRTITHGKSDSLSILGSVVNNRVIGPGEEIKLFHIWGADLTKIDGMFESLKQIKYTICYCSVYDECWTSQGLTVVEGCKP